MLNPEVPAFIDSGARWSLAASNPWHLEEIASGTRGPVRSLGRSPLAFAVRGEEGAIVTNEAEIGDVLGRAQRIGVTGAGTSGGTFARLLDRLGLTGDITGKVIPLAGGEPMRHLIDGQIDLAVLPLSNIAPISGVRPIVICPWEAEVHIDLALCLHPNASHGTEAFADWLMAPERDATLATLGLMRA